MQSRFLFVGLLIFLNAGVFAQASDFTIRLEPKGKFKTYNFYISEVIDNRADRTSLGTVYWGSNNAGRKANFNESFNTHLYVFFSSILPSSKEHTPIVISINHLSIAEEELKKGELGRSEAEVEFFKEQEGQLLSLGIFKAAKEKSLPNVTDSHDDRIINVLAQCVKDFAESGWEKKTGIPKSQVDSVRAKYRFDYNASLKTGLYFSFDDLANNTPIDTIAYETKLVRQTKKKEHYQVFHKGTKKRVKHLYGYSDGKSIYLNSNNYAYSQTLEYFVKSHFIGPYIYFEDNYYDPGMATTFGVTGVVISNKKTSIALETKSGLAYQLNASSMKKLLQDYPLLLSIYEHMKKNRENVKDLILQLNEKLESKE